MARAYTTTDSRRFRHFVCRQLHPSGQNGAISEAAIKAALLNQISTIGSDARLVASTMTKAEQQRQANIADLRLEREVAQRALADMENELHELLQLGDRAAAVKERIDQIDHRMKDISLELASLESQSVEEDDLRTTLSQFWMVWESLNSREQVRIIGNLIDGIAYNGATNKLR